VARELRSGVSERELGAGQRRLRGGRDELDGLLRVDRTAGGELVLDGLEEVLRELHDVVAGLLGALFDDHHDAEVVCSTVAQGLAHVLEVLDLPHDGEEGGHELGVRGHGVGEAGLVAALARDLDAQTLEAQRELEVVRVQVHCHSFLSVKNGT